jgi:hypothetical protein
VRAAYQYHNLDQTAAAKNEMKKWQHHHHIKHHNLDHHYHHHHHKLPAALPTLCRGRSAADGEKMQLVETKYRQATDHE